MNEILFGIIIVLFLVILYTTIEYGNYIMKKLEDLIDKFFKELK